ncbi:hypothetical protein RhiTH_011422 [Rhizoctonia solani]
MPLIAALKDTLAQARYKLKRRLASESQSIQLNKTASNPADRPAPELEHNTASVINTPSENMTLVGSLLVELESSVEACGPLKSAISGLRACVDIYKSACKEPKEYDQLERQLRAILADLAVHIKQPIGLEMTDCVKRIQSDIAEEANKVAVKQASATGIRLLQALEGPEGINECYRRIDSHLQRLMLNTNISTLKVVNEQSMTAHEHTLSARLDRMCPSMSAVYKSCESIDVQRRGCTPGTRRRQIELLLEWANTPDTGRTCWMNGMAGTGKTTIAYSVCVELEKTSRLGASFFCSRTIPECRKVKYIIPSISYQIARFSAPFRYALAKVLELDRDVHTETLKAQYQKLIVDPLVEVQRSMPTDFIVVIDALDECDNENSVGQILDLLIASAPILPVRFLISSRPENEITHRITGRYDGEDEARLVLHNLQEDAVKDDIELYMRDELKDIILTEAQWTDILERCGTLFIYASTTCHFIRQEYKVDAASEAVNTITNSPYMPIAGDNPIDSLYLTILKTVFEKSDMSKESAEKMKHILDTVICAVEPITLDAIADLLGLKSVKQVYRLLQPLRSVLNVPRDTGAVTTLHASFPDFMFSPTRSVDFYCDRTTRHAKLVEACLRAIDQAEPKMNICRLPSSHLLDHEVEDLKARVAWAISPGLAYACRYWSAHLDCSEHSPKLLGAVRNFFVTRLLLWMEVSNLTNAMQYGVGTKTIECAERWCAKNGAPEGVTQIAHDAWQFVSVFANHPVCQSTPHIYISMLPFWPRSRPISLAYMPRTSDLVRPTGTAIGRRQLALMATWKVSNEAVGSISLSDNENRLMAPTDAGIDILDMATGESVHSLTDERAQDVWLIVMSPDDTQVAFAKDGGILYLWDTGSNGAISTPLPEDVSGVLSIAFSVDGSRVACGLRSGDVYVYPSRHTTRSHRILRGHTNQVRSVAFSPNGSHLASGSADKTIRVWNIQTGGQAVRVLKGHTDWVRSVCYSTDGLQLASASDDRTIRLWDPRTGKTVLEPLIGHSSVVLSITFSPNGKLLASGSADRTIRVYDAVTGRVALGPLKGHTRWVNGVKFSHDGTRLFSCSSDGTVRIWNVQDVDTNAGQMATPGSTSSTWSIRYARSGKRIVSGSQDGTIHVWNTETGELVLGPLRGHKAAVACVDYSSDDQYIASASYDSTLHIWDSHVGKDIHGPMRGHSRTVNCVRFLPHGLAIVSGSDDGTVRMWDVSTGQQLALLLEAHSRIFSVAVSPNGQHVLCGSENGAIQLVDRHGDRALDKTINGHNDWVRSMEFSDGMHFVSGSHDHSVRIWDGQTGRQLVVCGERDWAHDNLVLSVSISLDGLYVASSSDDRTVRVWDGQTGKLILGPLRGHTDWVRCVQFSPDGSHVASCSDDGTIRFWDVSGCKAESLDHGSTNAGMGLPGLCITGSMADEALVDIKGAISDGSGEKTLERWIFDEDGWIMESQKGRVVWVPSELRACLLCPLEDLRIAVAGFLRLELEGSKVGQAWAGCYHPWSKRIH